LEDGRLGCDLGEDGRGNHDLVCVYVGHWGMLPVRRSPSSRNALDRSALLRKLFHEPPDLVGAVHGSATNRLN
jgi:hypothetical protein